MLDLPGTEIYALSVRERYSIVDRGKLIHYWKIKVIAWSFDCVGKKTTFKEKADPGEKSGNVFAFSNPTYKKTICFLGFLIWQNRLIQFHILSIPLVNKIRYLSKIAVFFATRKINFFVLSHRLQEHS